VVVIKLNASATQVLYCTLLGASTNNADTTGDTVARGVAVDGKGQAVVVGYTQGYNFPVTKHALQKLLGYGKGTLGSQVDGFVTKFNATGTGLIYSTYLGGSGLDYADHVALDGSGDAYVVGQTNSQDFPVAPHALQATYSGGDYDAYVTKLNASGSNLIFSTFIGQTSADQINGMVLDGAGSVYLTGQTNGGILRTIGVVQPSSGGGLDAFVMKLSARGVIEYSTYLGGQGDEIGNAIAIDPIGNAYVTGSTTSATFNTPVFPLSHQLQGSLGGNRGGFGMQDAFIAKLNTCGSALLYSSYLGGTFTDAGNAIAVDSHGNAYIAGTTMSPNFPLLRPLNIGGEYVPPAPNIFIAKIADRQESSTRSCPLPLILNLSAPSVSSTGVLTVTVHTAPGALVKTSLVVLNTVPPPTPVKGVKPVKGPKPPALGAILYRKTMQGHADAYGLYVGGLHVNYKITAAVQATLSLQTFLGPRTASATQPVQISP
jgi:hypothetical protein